MIYSRSQTSLHTIIFVLILRYTDNYISFYTIIEIMWLYNYMSTYTRVYLQIYV